jgi:hypothetical protein
MTANSPQRSEDAAKEIRVTKSAVEWQWVSECQQ